MPDKRDMHQAKSHRTSKNTKQQHPQAARREQGVQASAGTSVADPMQGPDLSQKRNKSRR